MNAEVNSLTHNTRRDFLKLGVLAGGGLVLGIGLSGCSKPAAIGAGGQPVAWLRIAGDNTIVSDQVLEQIRGIMAES